VFRTELTRGACDAISRLLCDCFSAPVNYRGHFQPPDFISPCGEAAGETRPITLKRAFCSSVNKL
jgi:hypothetical protein